MSVQHWWRDWSGETCVLVASGPSANAAPLWIARGKARFIAINRSWELAPWADVLYGCDYKWWKSVNGCPEFRGLKIAGEERVASEPWGVEVIALRKAFDHLVFDEPGTMGWGSNSGFHALNLAVQFGAKRILLVGYDATIEFGSHWFGKHGDGLNNPTNDLSERWRSVLDNAAPELAKRGIEVINCSQTSALRNYPKMNFAEAL